MLSDTTRLMELIPTLSAEDRRTLVLALEYEGLRAELCTGHGRWYRVFSGDDVENLTASKVFRQFGAVRVWWEWKHRTTLSHRNDLWKQYLAFVFREFSKKLKYPHPAQLKNESIYWEFSQQLPPPTLEEEEERRKLWLYLVMLEETDHANRQTVDYQATDIEA